MAENKPYLDGNGRSQEQYIKDTYKYTGVDDYGVWHGSNVSQDKVNSIIAGQTGNEGIWTDKNGIQYKQQLEKETKGANARETTEENYRAAVDYQKQANEDLINSITANKGTINDNYDESQRQAYINYVLGDRRVDDFMKARGYDGGITETTKGQVYNQYQENRLQATLQRDAALREMDSLVAQAQATGNTNLANLASQYMNTYLNALNMDRNYEQQLYSNQWNEKVYGDSMNQTNASTQYDAFLNTFKSTYKNDATTNNKIAELQQLIQTQGDPYGVYASEIAYLNAWKKAGYKDSTTTTSTRNPGTPTDDPTPKSAQEWYQKILDGKYTIDDVPSKYKNDVQALMDKATKKTDTYKKYAGWIEQAKTTESTERLQTSLGYYYDLIMADSKLSKAEKEELINSMTA